MHHKGAIAGGSHPAPFLIGLPEAIIEAYSDPGDILYEPFCGSGTQILAANRLGRICCAMELDPAYVDVAVRHWQMATGKEALLEGNGQRFNEI